MEQLLEDYRKRLQDIMNMLENDNNSSQVVTASRQAKALCYEKFISDLEALLNDKQ